MRSQKEGEIRQEEEEIGRWGWRQGRPTKREREAGMTGSWLGV